MFVYRLRFYFLIGLLFFLLLKLEFIDYFINFCLLLGLHGNTVKSEIGSFLSLVQVIPVLINENIECAKIYPDMRDIYLQHMIND